jgi:hypothetical protein
MNEPTVLLPVKCPQCTTGSMAEFPIIVVVTALTRWNHMALYGTCDHPPWDASAQDLEAMREYLGLPDLDGIGKSYEAAAKLASSLAQSRISKLSRE